MHAPIAYYNSPRKALLLLLLSAGFVAIGWFMTGEEQGFHWVVGWICIGFFGLGLPLGVWQLLDRRPRLVLDAVGVFDRTLGVGRIPWSQIVAARLESIHDQPFIALQLRDPQPWLATYSPLQRGLVQANLALGFAEFNLNLSGVAARPKQVLAEIQARLSFDEQ